MAVEDTRLYRHISQILRNHPDVGLVQERLRLNYNRGENADGLFRPSGMWNWLVTDLNEAFTWAQTIEGVSFWRRVNNIVNAVASTREDLREAGLASRVIVGDNPLPEQKKYAKVYD